MSFGKLQGLGQQYVQRLGGLDPMNQETATDAQKEAAKLAGRRELFARLSDAFGGRDIGAEAMKRQIFLQQRAEEEKKEKARSEFLKKNPGMASMLQALEAGVPYQLLQEDKPVKGPSSYEEYIRTDSTPTEQEYEQFLLNKTQAGATKIDTAQKAEDFFAQEGLKAGFATKKEIDKQIESNSELLTRVKLSKDLLLEGVETGVLEEFLQPFRSMAISLGVADEETINKYSQQELFRATTDYLVPRMRVVGSGATSDREIELFKSTVPTLGRTPKGNLVIAAGLEAMFEYNKRRGFLADQYLKDNKNLLGFGEYADQELGPLYESYSSDQEFDQKVRDGKLKVGDFVLDKINGQFRVLTEEDIQGI